MPALCVLSAVFEIVPFHFCLLHVQHSHPHPHCLHGPLAINPKYAASYPRCDIPPLLVLSCTVRWCRSTIPLPHWLVRCSVVSYLTFFKHHLEFRAENRVIVHYTSTTGPCSRITFTSATTAAVSARNSLHIARRPGPQTIIEKQHIGASSSLLTTNHFLFTRVNASVLCLFEDTNADFICNPNSDIIITSILNIRFTIISPAPFPGCIFHYQTANLYGYVRSITTRIAPYYSRFLYPTCSFFHVASCRSLPSPTAFHRPRSIDPVYSSVLSPGIPRGPIQTQVHPLFLSSV
ncbi:OLFR [Acanthosepion pharaonis]|uniref:OLFR n=1 Tax=Acanthosepion pharaonis TaxID=158019 RepID=A0A812DCD7_ACAPH|nr:OLFR [Sepia pharaonis]